MEIKIYEQENTGLFVPTKAAIAVLERGFVEALDSPKIKDVKRISVLEAVSAAIEKAWFELGLKQIPDNEMDQLKINIVDEIYACFTCLTLREIGNAIYHGARGKYGKVYSLTVIGVAKWFAEYMTDQNRLEALKVSAPQLPPKAKPSRQELFELSKETLLQAMDKRKARNDIGQLGPVVYNFLNELQLLHYTTKEKRDIMELALAATINDVRKSIALTPDPAKAAGLRRQLNTLIAAQEPNTAVPEDEYQMVVRTAKKLTVEAWLNECEMDEADIGKIIEAKREFYYALSH